MHGADLTIKLPGGAARGALPGHRARRAHRDRRRLRAGHAVRPRSGSGRARGSRSGKTARSRCRSARCCRHLGPPAQDHHGQPAQRVPGGRPHGRARTRRPRSRCTRSAATPDRARSPSRSTTARRMQDAEGHTATLTIPAQVGPDVPDPALPAGPAAGRRGRRAAELDIGQLCHVWVDTTSTPPAPVSYAVSWAKPAGGVSASVPGGTSLQLTAASGAAPGATGTLKITPAGAAARRRHCQRRGHQGAAAARGQPGERHGQGQPQRHGRPQPVRHQPARAAGHPGGRRPGRARRDDDEERRDSSPSPLPARPPPATPLAATVTDMPGRADREISIPIAVTVATASGFPGAPGAADDGGVEPATLRYVRHRRSQRRARRVLHRLRQRHAAPVRGLARARSPGWSTAPFTPST